MLDAGTYHKLTVARISEHGLYLADEAGSEVLLPNRYVSLENRVGDTLDVFVYHDSEDRLIATTEKPLARVGEVAFLRAVDKTAHGAFLDWGITAKDIFLPNRNMHGYVEPQHSYIVYVYRDSITGRAVASMNLRSFISNDELSLRRGEQVEMIVTQRTERGYRVVIRNRYWGMIYDNQIFGDVRVGDRLTGWVRRITDDNRVDVSLQQEGYDEVRASADRLLTLLDAAGGSLPLHDASAPEQVAALTGMSKKVFKRTVGYLMKRGEIEMSEGGIARAYGDTP
ncbi:MAG: S1-like domain-containing RNA-binding protein [Rikenellaceae bacterium]|nr:S1-like domain-containing RNA-binding protein [Rikenellaceae bacterium]MCL2691985.1 S1-like domain-containing RNA-binding protein [Rikenellaceae bacterium]